MPSKLPSLSEKQKEEIIAKYNFGMSRRALSKMYNLSYAKLNSFLQRVIRKESEVNFPQNKKG